MQYELCGIGTCGWDILRTPDGIVEASGGSILNTIIRSQDLGMDSVMLSRMGQDDYGNKLHDFLMRRHFKFISSIKRDSYPTSFCELVVKEDGDREIVNLERSQPYSFVDDGMGGISAEESLSIFLNVRRDDIEHIMDFCDALRKPVFTTMHSFDISKNPTSIQGALDNVLRYDFDIIFANEQEYEASEDYLKDAEKRGSVLALTRGKDGCEIRYRGKTIYVPGFDVKSIDATGAGDSFAAGFIYGYLEGFDMERCALLGNAMGALATTHYGAAVNRISREDVSGLIRNVYPEWQFK